MKAFRAALTLGVAAASAIGTIVVNSGWGLNASASTELDVAVLQTLNEIDAHGWNPTTNGLYINWSIADTSQVNLPSGSKTLHDKLTDLRDLVNMYWYESRHPGDTTQQAAIGRLLPVAKAEFSGYASDKGWVYWQLLHLASLTGDSFWSSEAKNFAAHAYSSIDPTYGVAHGSLTASTAAGAATCPDGYRIDHNLESGLALADAGKRFGNSAWSTAGAREVTVVTQQGYNTTYHLYNRIICQWTVWDGQAKMGEQAEEVLAYLDAGSYLGDSTYLAKAQEMLDGLVANSTGLHDTLNGGFFFKYNMLTQTLDNSYKEPRQLTLLTSLHRADALFGGRYSSLEGEMTSVVLQMQNTNPLVGYFYRETPTFGQFQSENWITTEAGGIAAEAMQSVLDGGTVVPPQPSATPVPTVKPTPTPAPSTTPAPTPTPTPSTSGSPDPGTKTVQRSIYSGESQSFFVTVGTGGTLTANVSWPGGTSLSLTIYDAKSTVTYSKVAGTSSPLSAQLTGLAAGNYKVKVHDDGPAATTYTIVVTTS